MPLYGFNCQDCQTHFEVIRSISQAEDPPPKCENCGSDQTLRKMGTVMAVFGSGSTRNFIGGSACGSCAPQSPSACSGCSSKR